MNNDSQGFNIRDIFWNYPRFFSHIFRITNPLPFVLLSIVCGYFVFMGLTSDFVLRFVEGRDLTIIREGTVGTLLSTNPMYTTQNSVDRDFYKLVYEKFIEVDSDGSPQPGIAVVWEQVGDLEYVFTIKEDILWHDGRLLTADDVVWNFKTAISLHTDFGEDTYGSALEGVEIEKIAENKVKFVLKETNATFWEAISVYLIPKHVYELVPLGSFSSTKSKSNPVGCGVYKVSSINDKGFKLESFTDHWEEPVITRYKYFFFEDYVSLNNALKNNELDVVNTFDLEQIENLEEYPFFGIKESVLYNREKIIYFNTRREKFSDPRFRSALSLLVDTERLLELAQINAVPLNGPVSPKSWAFNDTLNYTTYRPEEGREILQDLGFVKDAQDEYFITAKDEKILSLELAFFENELNTRLVTTLQSLFKEEGIFLKLKPLSYEQMVRELLPTRDYELLLYEIEITADPDQYNLWHSLRIDHPMLNISGYDYSRVDILLERARTEIDREKRKEDYFLFQRYLVNDAPVIFLYNPKISFVVREGLVGLENEELLSPSDRYENVSQWYWLD